MKNMKKYKLLKILTVLMFCVTLCQPAVLAADDTVNVTLNGTKLSFDQDPIIENGRTLVPLRKIFESLNAFVEWEKETQTVTARKHSTEISLVIGSNIAKVNGENYTLDVPAKVVNGRTLVPARFVAESLNCKVDWNDNTNTVIIKTGKQTDEKNLIKTDELLYGYVYDLSGKRIKNNDYYVTDLIRVVPGKTLYFSLYGNPVQARSVSAYDANINAIYSEGKQNITEYVIPNGVEYIRANIYRDYAAGFRISYDKFPDGYISDEICVAEGRKITIYAKQLISERRDDLKFTWECEVGSEVDGNYEIIGDGKFGNYPLKVTATDAEGNVLFVGDSIVKIVKNEICNIKFLAIGDSHTNNKKWMDKLDELSLGKITFVGTRGGKYKHEGRSGFTSAGYVSAQKYDFENEGVHQFWDGERFNWNYYKETTEVDPDVVQLFIGGNGIKNNPESNVSNIMKIIDYIKNDDPNIPIFVVEYIYKGTLTEEAEHKKVFNLMRKLADRLSGYDNVFMIPAAITHDSENNYSFDDQVHPQDAGYEQIASAIYSSLCTHLK